MIEGRQLERDEISQVWSIDRSEVIRGIYRLASGTLELHPEHHDVRGWPPGEEEKYTPLLEACHTRGGWLHGLFDGEALVASAIVDTERLGPDADLLQLKFLHTSRAYRGRGLGRGLFALAKAEARRRGASGLYVSATPSQHTIDFYLGLGCEVTTTPDPDLFALEPEDIHLECRTA